MNKFSFFTKLICLIAGFLFSGQFALAQFSGATRMLSNYERRKAKSKGVKSYLSYEVRFGRSFASGDFSHTYPAIDKSGNSLGTRVINSEFDLDGWNVGAGTYFRLFDVSNKSIAAFNVGVDFTFVTYEPGEFRLDEVGVYNYTYSLGKVGVPLALDLKFGGEAVYDKTEKASFTIGAGLCPEAYISNFGPASNLVFDIRPYVHAELGIFAAIEWKIRATYMPGNTKILDLGEGNAGMEGIRAGSNIVLNHGNTFMVGIALMPFSFDWKKGW